MASKSTPPARPAAKPPLSPKARLDARRGSTRLASAYRRPRKDVELSKIPERVLVAVARRLTRALQGGRLRLSPEQVDEVAWTLFVEWRPADAAARSAG